MRLCVSTERPVKSRTAVSDLDIVRDHEIIREKDRRTYAYGGFRVDLTLVSVVGRRTPPCDVAVSDDEFPTETYELEVEVEDPASTEAAWNVYHALIREIEPELASRVQLL